MAGTEGVHTHNDRQVGTSRIGVALGAALTRIKSLVGKVNGKIYDVDMVEQEVSLSSVRIAQNGHTTEALKPEHFDSLLAKIDQVEEEYDKLGTALQSADASISRFLNFLGSSEKAERQIKK